MKDSRTNAAASVNTRSRGAIAATRKMITSTLATGSQFVTGSSVVALLSIMLAGIDDQWDRERNQEPDNLNVDPIGHACIFACSGQP